MSNCDPKSIVDEEVIMCGKVESTDDGELNNSICTSANQWKTNGKECSADKETAVDHWSTAVFFFLVFLGGQLQFFYFSIKKTAVDHYFFFLENPVNFFKSLTGTDLTNPKWKKTQLLGPLFFCFHLPQPLRHKLVFQSSKALYWGVFAT